MNQLASGEGAQLLQQKAELIKPGLECRGVGFSWDVGLLGETEVLKDISFQLKDGEFVSVIGPSGCGKSTLLNILCGLLTPTMGNILMDNYEISGQDNKIGIVFQEYGLFPWLNVQHNVEFGMKMNGISKIERRSVAQEVLNKVGLLSSKGKFPHQLSGGMRQRVSIARVLANNPKYLLMDEPFGALDYQTRLLMQLFLLDIWRKFGKAILFVTHQVEEALILSERVFLMASHPGVLVEEIKVDLPYPRDIGSKKFNEYRIHITTHLEKEVMKGFREQSF